MYAPDADGRAIDRDPASCSVPSATVSRRHGSAGFAGVAAAGLLDAGAVCRVAVSGEDMIPGSGCQVWYTVESSSQFTSTSQVWRPCPVNSIPRADRVRYPTRSHSGGCRQLRMLVLPWNGRLGGYENRKIANSTRNIAMPRNGGHSSCGMICAVCLGAGFKISHRLVAELSPSPARPALAPCRAVTVPS